MRTGSYSTVREPEDGITLPRCMFFILAALLIILIILVVALPLAIYLNQQDCTRYNDSAGGTTIGPGPTNAPLVDTKLARDFLPSLYDLTLRVNLPANGQEATNENAYFNGTVSIGILCVTETDTVHLHADQSLTVHYDTVTITQVFADQSTQSVNVPEANIVYDMEKQTLAVKATDLLKVGNQYRIAMGFRSALSTGLDGFFRSSYVEDGVTKHLAATQFQPQSARKAIPCFDEPDLKATFSVKIFHPINTTALSNGREISSSLIDATWKRTDFETTPRMSTYLLTFFVSQFLYRTSITSKGTTLRVWASAKDIGQTAFASQVGPVILDYFDSWFNYAYPLSKLDMVALKDFDAGGMENWGIVLFKDRFILQSDTNNDSVEQKRHTVLIIAHELAHQWFGNLVTMKSWDDLWLNEGFANYLQYYGADKAVNGSLQMTTQFVAITMDRALYLDSLDTHPLHTDNQLNYDHMFDTITYDKGASVIHMLENVVGASEFQRALDNYISLYRYNNADHNQLWAAFTDGATSNNVVDWTGSTLNISQLMECWITRPGYPLVTVDRNYQANTATIAAAVFSLIENYTQPVDIPCVSGWYIPIWYKQSSDTINLIWLQPSEVKSFALNGNGNDYLLLNPRAKGFYRVNYDDQNWKDILDVLNNDHTKFHVNSRTQILNDAYALAKTGNIEYGIALAMSKYLRAELQYAPWLIATKYLFIDLQQLMKDSASLGLYKDYLQRIIKPVYHRIDFLNSLNTNVLIDQLFLSLIYSHACKLDEQNCIILANYYFSDLKSNCIDATKGTSGQCNRVPANIRETVYSTGIRKGTVSDWEWMWQRMTNEDVSSERHLHFAALAAYNNSTVLQMYADRLISSITIQQSDIPFALASIATTSPIGLTVVWDTLRNQFETIFEKFKGTDTFAMLLTTVIKELNSQLQLDQANLFINDHKDALGASFVEKLQKECLENVKTNIRWKEKYMAKVETWLSNQANK